MSLFARPWIHPFGFCLELSSKNGSSGGLHASPCLFKRAWVEEVTSSGFMFRVPAPEPFDLVINQVVGRIFSHFPESHTVYDECSGARTVVTVWTGRQVLKFVMRFLHGDNQQFSLRVYAKTKVESLLRSWVKRRGIFKINVSPPVPPLLPSYKSVHARVCRIPVDGPFGPFDGTVEFVSLPSRDLETPFEIVDLLISSENDYWENRGIPRTDPPVGSVFYDQ